MATTSVWQVELSCGHAHTIPVSMRTAPAAVGTTTICTKHASPEIVTIRTLDTFDTTDDGPPAVDVQGTLYALRHHLIAANKLTMTLDAWVHANEARLREPDQRDAPVD